MDRKINLVLRTAPPLPGPSTASGPRCLPTCGGDCTAVSTARSALDSSNRHTRAAMMDAGMTAFDFAAMCRCGKKLSDCNMPAMQQNDAKVMQNVHSLENELILWRTSSFSKV